MGEAELAEKYRLDNWNEEQKDAEIARLNGENLKVRVDLRRSAEERHLAAIEFRDEISRLQNLLYDQMADNIAQEMDTNVKAAMELRAELALLKSERDAAVAKCAIALEFLSSPEACNTDEMGCCVDAEKVLFDYTKCQGSRCRVQRRMDAFLANPDPAAQELLRDRGILDWADSHPGVYASWDDSDPREGDLTFREMLNYIKQDVEENPNA